MAVKISELLTREKKPAHGLLAFEWVAIGYLLISPIDDCHPMGQNGVTDRNAERPCTVSLGYTGLLGRLLPLAMPTDDFYPCFGADGFSRLVVS